MSATYEVRYTDAARADLLRLFDDLLDHAETVEDFDAAQATIDAVRQAVEVNLRAAPSGTPLIGSLCTLRGPSFRSG